MTTKNFLAIVSANRLPRFGNALNARAKQRARFSALNLQRNGDMGPGEVRRFCKVDDTRKNLLRSAMQQMQFSARAYHRILKLAQTIADLAEAVTVNPSRLTSAQLAQLHLFP